MKTNVRETSLRAYDAIKADGTAATQAGRVLRFIRENPRCSRKEISDATRIPINAITGRVKELLEDGAVRECGQKEDRWSGKNVNVLEVVPAQHSLLVESR